MRLVKCLLTPWKSVPRVGSYSFLVVPEVLSFLSSVHSSQNSRLPPLIVLPKRVGREHNRRLEVRGGPSEMFGVFNGPVMVRILKATSDMKQA